MEDDRGLYCGTAGAFFQDKETLVEHYKSEFHRYNLKRKVAGLPPVTREWYDARKSQLLGALDTSAKRVWQDPLTGKRFASENTYLAFTRSKKYQELVRKSGQPAPAPRVQLAQRSEEQESAPAARPVGPTTHKVVPLARPAPEADTSDESEWETEDEDEVLVEESAMEEGVNGSASPGGETQADAPGPRPGSEDWEDWDVRVSLFDNRVSESMEANLAYMFKTFGFYLPDAEHLADPEGLLKYLGAKLRYGHVPLYARGDDAEARSFRSLEAVQHHMVATVRCKMLFDGNEDEYADFYDWEGEEEDDEGADPASSLALALGAEPPAEGPAEYELAVPLPGGGTRFLGTREFARYYRQRHRGGERRAALSKVAAVLAQYRKLAVPVITAGAAQRVEAKRAQRAQQQRFERQKLAIGMARNINDKLPKNVPY
ncbi:hypothetical protein QBZ16_001804 [Prototheca wickerhamii]|uniref:ZN622/Rei1/Reh1 zinc finger C2H2-type domain-containing protein n=1 Tax=Prototheca wickerhamii TaxID=3111 RepID=A0AAD9IFI0_PROWI|nr:hypothetical protein QBZ16_001804 [Prototheca wickerhamii]